MLLSGPGAGQVLKSTNPTRPLASKSGIPLNPKRVEADWLRKIDCARVPLLRHLFLAS
jgi:hypothetical protein